MSLAAPLRHAAFTDTSAYYALVDEQDRDHPEAVARFARLTRERWHLVTTNFVVAELHALLLHRLGRAVAARVLFDVDHSPGVTLVRVSESQEQRARAIISRYTDKDYSLTDATSFAVMEELGLNSAFSFDRHFGQYGYRLMHGD